MLPDGERTIAGYMILMGERVAQAESLLGRGDLTGIPELVREIDRLAREAIATLAATPASVVPLGRQSLSDYLVDIESAVLRYKAHRPGLRSPDAGPKVLNHLLEILSAASGCLEQHGWERS